MASAGALPLAAYWYPKKPKTAATIKITIALIGHAFLVVFMTTPS
jgi:hypothetical protein